MLTRRILPCLDVSNGRVVKGIKFQGLRDAGDPRERAGAYQDQGADELVILDVSATPEGRGHQTAVVQSVRHELRIPLTVGGGVRRLEDAARLLDAGADKVAVNTAAVLRPDLLDEMAGRFGSQCTVLAVDARRTDEQWEVRTHSGATSAMPSALDWIEQAAGRGVGEILLTSWDQDGTGQGYDLELLEAASERCSVPIIASGGAAGVEHMVQAFSAGADAVLAATIFHDGHTTVADVKQQLAVAGVVVRPLEEKP